MRTLKYGGQLSFGDFIAVSNGNHISFGWYAGDGRGTLQYYWMGVPGQVYEDYLQWKNNPSSVKNWRARHFEKHGFSIKLFYKSYINAVHATRVMKITNPEDIFTDKQNREEYERSKEALITLNFIKK
jgi:hypothetical protein